MIVCMCECVRFANHHHIHKTTDMHSRLLSEAHGGRAPGPFCSYRPHMFDKSKWPIPFWKQET